MQWFREEHVRVTRQLAGDRYSSNAANKRIYVNLLSLYVKILVRNLISQNPRCMLSTFDDKQRASVSAAESWLNEELVRQDFASKMKRLVLDGLITMGIAKVSLATPADAAMTGWEQKAGFPCISQILLDDFVIDHRARCFEEISFIGHRYRAPMAVVMENPHFSKKAKDKLKPRDQISWNREGDERISEIGRDHQGYDEDLEDMVELWEFYLPRHKKIVTITEDDMSGPGSVWEGGEPIALGEQAWIGPSCGPYHLLAYEIIPGNLFPKGPLQDVVNLHEGANEGYRKLMRQAANFKKVTAGLRDNPEDAKTMQDANDATFVLLSQLQNIREIVTGGQDPNLYLWVKENIGRFMEQAGNLATMGGLAPQAHTLGQEELLSQQSNGQLAGMQDITHKFVSDIADAMLWYFWHDPRLVMRSKLNDPRLPDVNMVRQVFPAGHFDPRALKRDGEKPELKIDPYTLRASTPQQRFKDLVSVVTQLYMPMAQMFERRGITLDPEKLLAIAARSLDQPDLPSVLTITEPPVGNTGNSPSGEGGSEGGGVPPPPREYIRRSLGGNSKAAEEGDMMNGMSAAAASNGKPKQMIH